MSVTRQVDPVVPTYFHWLPSHCVLAMSSHVIEFLLAARQGLPRRSGRCSLLPLAAIALRLGGVVPRHDLPPCLARADLLLHAASLTVLELRMGVAYCSSPRS
jgi:hypothetical protein